MNKLPYFQITPDGVLTPLDNHTPQNPNIPYRDKPMQISIHRDCSIELHGVNFSAIAVLSPDEALGVAQMLLYVAREALHCTPTEFVQVAK